MKKSQTSSLVWCVMVVAAGAASAGDWPQWRGPDRNDVSQETGLLKKWPAEGPKRLWLNETVGLGYSGFSIVGGRLFTMGARDGTEFLICLDVNTGEEKWATALGAMLDNRWVSLGTYRFVAARSAAVEVDATAADGNVHIDAVQVLPAK